MYRFTKSDDNQNKGRLIERILVRRLSSVSSSVPGGWSGHRTSLERTSNGTRQRSSRIKDGDCSESLLDKESGNLICDELKMDIPCTYGGRVFED